MYPFHLKINVTIAGILSIWHGLKLFRPGTLNIWPLQRIFGRKDFFQLFFNESNVKHFFTDSKLSQIMTEHGKFKSYLCKLKLTDSDICSCGQDAETAKHLLL